MSDAATSYDAVPYDSLPFVETHPDRLATVGTLHGLQPPAIDRCRVLELGCAHGHNLMPMAVSLPQSHFLGIDLSRRQIADGQSVITALELTNIELKPLGILDVDDGFGTFDYIICHGVYSWVPADVQRKILDVCARQLTPDGIAFVSYNTYPGWFVRQMVRELMLYHARQFAEPQERVRQARAFLDFLAKAVVPDPGSTYGTTLQGAAEALRKQGDSYVLHEYLEEVNEPLYFRQFVERIEAHGLRYVADARLTTSRAGLAPGVDQALQQLASDPIRQAQYLDFLTRRSFRRSLLCRADRTPSAAPLPERLAGLLLAAPLTPAKPDTDLLTPGVKEFRTTDGRAVAAADLPLKAALSYLGEAWPRVVPWPALWSAVRDRLGQLAGDERTLMAEVVRALEASNLIEMHVAAPPCRAEVSDRPAASPLARYQAGTGSRVTNLRHEIVELNDFNRQLLRLLDGTRDRTTLQAALATQAEAGGVAYWHEGLPVTDAAQFRQRLPELLERHLAWMARSSLLVG